MRLTELERRTFSALLVASIFQGFVLSSFQTQDIIAKKALHALDWQVTILVMLWPLSNLFSIWWGKILEHSHKLSRYFILAGIFGRLVLLLMLWITSYYQYMGIMILVFSFNAFISPAQNSILQNNIQKQNRGNLFGYTASLVTLVSITFSFVAGKLLDVNENWFRYFFALVGILGLIHCIIMSRIKLKKSHNPEKAFLSLQEVFFKPIARTIEVLKKNKDFAVFQRNFMIYGIAYMILLPAIPKYLVETLKMEYSQTFLAKSILSQVGILILAPLAGRFFDKKNPAFFTALSFALISFYPIILLISLFHVGTVYVNYIVYLAFLIYSVAMTGIVISWNISSIQFAGDEDVSMYQSVHVTLTGIRGMIGPFLGLFIMEILGIKAVFITAIFLFLLAAYLSFRLYLRMDDKCWKCTYNQVLVYFRKIFPFN
ncbi:MAG: MFS transporter [Candidatus Cloacimonadales bacterium]|nr:MFS transporter [Candidatus Cloacimonadales bacterium]